MNKNIPTYIYKKANVNRLILFTAIFNLLFINAYEPFGSLVIYRTISEMKYFFLSSVIILDGMMVVVLSRLLMLGFLKKHAVTYFQYACWVLGEIVAMTLFFSLFATLSPQKEPDKEFVGIFNEFLLYASIVLLIPYSMGWIYFSWREKVSLNQKESLETQQDGMPSQDLIGIPDENGDLKIAVMPENLLYIESFKNFITINYLNHSRLSHFLIRNTLQKVEARLAADGSLVRCHCNYIINVEKVKVLHKDKGRVTLELNDLNLSSIPVSSAYYDHLISKLSEYSV
ncbi:MAG: LytTR family DNA-binding domain-containing protein [Paludibacter sp.]|nr:LytTR family DNA-binding domain-containing protein [Paludibacter sp.]